MRIGRLEIKLSIDWCSPRSKPKQLSWVQKRNVIKFIKGEAPVPGSYGSFVKGEHPSKISVIKYVRNVLGCDLKKSKEIVDHLYNIYPQKYSAAKHVLKNYVTHVPWGYWFIPQSMLHDQSPDGSVSTEQVQQSTNKED